MSFATQDELEARQGRFGAPRFNYLQRLVTEFQDSADEDAKLQIMANLANFAYDPINFEALRKLNVLDLFIDHLDEPSAKLVEFAIGGICNCCVDPVNAQFLITNGAIPLIIKCLSSPNLETVLSAITTLIYLADPSLLKEIADPAVVASMRRYAASANFRVKNLAMLYLQHIGQPLSSDNAPAGAGAEPLLAPGNPQS